MVFCAALELWRASGVPPADAQFFADCIRIVSEIGLLNKDLRNYVMEDNFWVIGLMDCFSEEMHDTHQKYAQFANAIIEG